MDFAYALRSFLGYLEGTEKSVHTIKNYRSDLMSFSIFLEKGLGSKPVALSRVNREDLEKFHSWLKAEGQKSNTRRRKLLTVRKLLKYLTLRNKIAIDVGQKLPAPHKIERIPYTVPSDDLIAAVRALPRDNVLQIRNQVLLWTLAETGCLVSEVTRLRFDQWSTSSGKSFLTIGGKSAREITVDRDLYDAVQALRERAGEREWLFFGFNRFGSLGSPITSRGVEMLVKVHSARLGFPKLTPRTFRHSAVLRWAMDGVTREELRRRLGLRTDYAFRVYDPLIKSRSTSTSTS